MENGEFTSQIEYDWPAISMDLVKSTWETVAWLVAELEKEGSIYSLDISKTEENPEILAQLMKNFILEIQKIREKSFTIHIKILSFQTEKMYLEMTRILKENDLIDSYKLIKTKNTSESHLHLNCD